MIHARPDYNRIQDPAGLIPADEPVLLIRGQDILAPEMAAYYRNLTRDMGGDEDVLNYVMDQEVRIQEWQRVNGMKRADVHAPGDPMGGPFDDGKPEWVETEDGESWVTEGKFSRTPENVYGLCQEMAECHGTLREAMESVLAGEWTLALGGDVPGGDGCYTYLPEWPDSFVERYGPPTRLYAVTVVRPDYS